MPETEFMSGKNWLERDPSQSPGLRRVTELNQADNERSIAEKVRSEKSRAEWGELLKQRAERVVLVEDMCARVLPIIRDIEGYANEKRIYPLGVEVEKLAMPLEIVKAAEVKIDKVLDQVDCPYADIELLYGFKGFDPKYEDEMSGGEWTQVYAGDIEVVKLYGIKAQIQTRDKKVAVLIHQQEVRTIPATGPGPGGFKMGWQPGKPERKEVVNISASIENPFDGQSLKHSLAEAFHNPVYLGTEPFLLRQEVVPQPELQTNAGIAGLVKGFLGIK